MMMAIVLVLALLIGVAASIYLEEFATKNRLTDLIEVNINNLAAVPSIVFGSARPGGVHQLSRHAALGGARRRHYAVADDAADHHHCHPRRLPPCRHRSAMRRWGWAPRRCRWCSTTCCRWPCPAS
jgi:hypothetical protein